LPLTNFNSEVKIRIATAEDYTAVTELGRSTFYESWIHMHSEEDMQLYLADAFTPEKIKKDLENPANTFILAYYNSELIGYAKLRIDRTYPQLNNEPAIEMERIYVMHKYHGVKAGRALMDKSLEIAREKKYKWMWLGVNQENSKAINFYKRYGFVIDGIKTFKLGNVIDDDFLMKMEL
jgi:ribosomal protein S18 acetylase RimI-like enzyme